MNTEIFSDCFESVIHRPREVFSYSLKPLRGSERFNWKYAGIGAFIGLGLANNTFGFLIAAGSFIMATSLFHGIDQVRFFTLGLIVTGAVDLLAAYHVGVYAGYKYSRV